MSDDAWQRREGFWRDPLPVFDVAVIGGGVQGACVYHHLAAAGYRVLLVDRGDFGGGTSQASAMLIWGGLLYLRDGDVREVLRLSAARDEMLRAWPQWAEAHTFRYVLGRRRHRPRALVQAALWAYWMLGGCRRRPPGRHALFAERDFLLPHACCDSLAFEEGRLQISDAQFVLRWILTAPANGSRAVNYCGVEGGGRDGASWRLELNDTLHGGRQRAVLARWVVNAAGVWCDGVNRMFGVLAPFKHAFSKGVSLTYRRRPEHRDTLILDSRRKDEGLSLVPWGPVSLWGSTETQVTCPEEGFRPGREDVLYLLDELNRHLARPLELNDVISVRCGVRPLAVSHSYRAGDPLRLSRGQRLWQDAGRQWVSVFGGKITGCASLARGVADLLRRAGHDPAAVRVEGPSEPPEALMERFDGIEVPVPSPGWCRQHALCWTMEDYLRRRTNIAQWVPRGGMGRSGECERDLLRVSLAFNKDATAAGEAVRRYVAAVDEDLARACGSVCP